MFTVVDEAKGLIYPPEKKYPTDAGWDLRAWKWQKIRRGLYVVRTGLSIAIPKGYFGLIKERSSWAMKGLAITGGVIDCGYTGEILVVANRFKDVLSTMPKEDNCPRFAQLLLIKTVDMDGESDRGTNGFGSTGNA